MAGMALSNSEAESHVLAGILRNPEAYWSINDVGLTPEDFMGTENRRVMKAIAAVVADKHDPDIPLLVEELNVSNAPATVEYLNKLTSLPFSLAQAKSAASTVKNLAVSRRLAMAGSSIVEIANENRTNIDVALAEAEGELREVRGLMPHNDRSPEPIDILRRLRVAAPEARVNLRFSPTLQAITGGLFPGHIWVIGGFSSVGKSAVACNFMYDTLAVRDRWVGLISTEMTQEQYLIRMLALHSGIPQSTIRDRVMTFEQQEAMGKAEQWLARANLRVFDDIYKVSAIRSQAMRMKQTTGLDVLVVDFMQNVRGSTGDFAFGDMTEVALDLQTLAKELQVTVIAFSQLSNAMAQQSMDPKADTDYYALKGSGAIKDAADLVVILKRKRASTNLDFELVKHRHGETGRTIPMQIDLKTGRIIEEDDWDTDD